MLDNLRDQISFQEEAEPLDPKAPKPPKPRRSFDQITGMTAQQRFALAVILTIVVSLLGAMLLVISGKVVPSFLF
jgi:hypothetical protein